MTHLWEPLRVMPKPLAVPLFSEAAGVLTRFLLRRQVHLQCLYGWLSRVIPRGFPLLRRQMDVRHIDSLIVQRLSC
jgi:hypothetical protein